MDRRKRDALKGAYTGQGPCVNLSEALDRGHS